MNDKTIKTKVVKIVLDALSLRRELEYFESKQNLAKQKIFIGIIWFVMLLDTTDFLNLKFSVGGVAAVLIGLGAIEFYEAKKNQERKEERLVEMDNMSSKVYGLKLRSKDIREDDVVNAILCGELKSENKE